MYPIFFTKAKPKKLILIPMQVYLTFMKVHLITMIATVDSNEATLFQSEAALVSLVPKMKGLQNLV